MNKLGTKAETLQMLYKKLECAEILPSYIFTVGEWRADFWKVKNRFLSLNWSDKVIVRSSSQTEDMDDRSQAGKYESVADVSGEEEFEIAVNKVIASYDDNNLENQVLVQPMLSDVCICGVAFTLDPNTLGNYYVINYDTHGSTSAVTAGNGIENKLYYRFKGQNGNVPERKSIGDAVSMARMDYLCQALQELEEFFGKNNLDIEFAFTEGDVLYILQVRTLCIQGKPVNRELQQAELGRIKEKISRE